MTKRPGPKQKPLHLVAGHRTKAERDERERSTPRPRPLAPKAPANLLPLERECWEHHAPELEHLGLFTTLDWAAFRITCQAYMFAMAAAEEMLPRKADGSIDRRKKRPQVILWDRDGEPRRHPGFIVWKQAQDAYRTWCGEFGLTPSSRVGLRPGAVIGNVQEDDDADSDDAFFGT